MENKFIKTLLTACCMLVSYGLVATCYMAKQDEQVLNVTSFGAIRNDDTDDRAAIQACIDKAADAKRVCYIPAGRYIINGDLWLPSGVTMKGDGGKSVLDFKKGALRILKNKLKEFSYTNNYNNEIVPGEQLAALRAGANSGATSLRLENAGSIAVGDLIYIYNNKRDSWTVLEDKSKTALWNSPGTEMARKELFIVKGKQGNTLVLDQPLKFSYKQGATVGRHVGAQQVTVTDLAISNYAAPYAVMLEQPRQVILKNLHMDANGGILLSHMAYKCQVLNCNINVTKNRAILVENFSAGNLVSNNTVNYTTGGDAAIMALMCSYDNTITENKVTGHGTRGTDEGGIFIHALCYGNKVYNNTITGTAEGVGAYYGAMDNEFYNNSIKGVRVGIISYYARNNDFYKNDIVIQTLRAGNTVGALIFCSDGITLTGNTISGNILFGVQLQASNACRVAGNNIQGISPEKYSFGIKVIPGKNKGAENQLGNNRINKVKTPVATQ
ncbi:glycosyl hydrolase family 28-related protein [Chitinophaga japonensis]|uniref:Parallel beta-helix repeat protein n=1 Tax=Chitinophaga japonensis TaxID=104662 RepID=A0A562T400_CHIJA|nr:glycosyl hydrolase family 28-related protein [Chitinophaga japonensis]TWI88222.1 parallel beta-helix repeat protein [Chitinophaga japonensis]